MAIDTNHVITVFTVIMAIASGASAFYAYQATKKAKAANKTAEQAFKNSQGDSEILIHTSISDALRRQDECLVKLIEAKEKYNNNEDHFAVKAYKTLSESATQGYLNAYDIACQRYLDNKLDQIRFKKTYSSRIKELFDEEKNYKIYLRDISSTNYHALHMVNEKLNNLEQH